MKTYPLWSYFPRNTRAPGWVGELLSATEAVQPSISTVEQPPDDSELDFTSDAILAVLRPGLEGLGYQVESGKAKHQKISRPVLFGDNGVPEVSYEIDAFHDLHGVAVEVEAGRGASNAADYRDIVRTSLLLDAEYLALFMPVIYRFKQKGKVQEKPAYANTRKQLNAIYASQRLTLPFRGLLLVGY